MTCLFVQPCKHARGGYTSHEHKSLYQSIENIPSTKIVRFTFEWQMKTVGMFNCVPFTIPWLTLPLLCAKCVFLQVEVAFYLIDYFSFIVAEAISVDGSLKFKLLRTFRWSLGQSGWKIDVEIWSAVHLLVFRSQDLNWQKEASMMIHSLGWTWVSFRN